MHSPPITATPQSASTTETNDPCTAARALLCTVEPRFSGGPRGTISRFFFIYLTMTAGERKSFVILQGLCYVEVCYIEVPL